jgi:hypothetical protein
LRPLDDLPELVDGPEQVAPGPPDFQVRLIDMPAITDHMLSSSCGIGELRREPLDPPVDRDVVDLGPALGQQVLDVPVGEAEPQVPADRQGDDFGWEPVPGEGRARRPAGKRVSVRFHDLSLADGLPPRQTQQSRRARRRNVCGD